MKTCFSTLGCPQWSWEEMISSAKDLGFDGIEIRGIENELYIPKYKLFSDNSIAATKEKIQKLNMQISCLTSSCCLFDKSNIECYLMEGKEYVDLASRLGVPYIRVLGDGSPGPGVGIDLDYTAENISILADYANGKDVVVLVETNGVFAASDEMLRLIGKINSPNVGVLWDVHHPYRYFKEPVEETYGKLKAYIKFVHIKDSVVVSDIIKYMMVGHGDVPVREALNLLKGGGYEGYVSLEWVKRWCIDLEEPGIVFSHFVNFMRSML